MLVPAAHDREGVRRGMGITQLAFKVLTADTGGGLFVIEQTFHGRGGPPRHMHPHQDEWFLCIEGHFVVEIGDRRHHLGAGDALLAPRGVPHVWACVGEGSGRMIVAFSPAGDMEAFLRAVSARDSMPAEDPELWRAHGMEVVGPPLQLG